MGRILGQLWLALMGFADDLVLLATSMTQAQRMLEELCEALARIGLIVNFGKCSWSIAAPEGGESQIGLKAPGGAGDIAREDDFNLLGSTISSNGEIEADVGRRVQAAWKAFHAHRTRLLRFGVSVTKRIGLLRRVVMPVLLWSTETWPLHDKAVRRIGAAYNYMVRKMLRIRRRPSETWLDWQKRPLRRTAIVVEENGGSAAKALHLRHWRYAGHLARQRCCPELRSILEWRGLEWQRCNRMLPWQWKKVHRKSGQQRLQWETLVDAYAGDCDWSQPWQVVAQDRQTWANLQNSFAEWAIGGL